MWDPRKNQAPPATSGVPHSPSGAPAGASPAPIPPASSAYRVEPVNRGSTISKAISIVGEVYCEEDMFIDGELKGTLEVKDGNVTVGPNGKADSSIKANEVVILGKVKGDVEAAVRTTIRRNGSLVGNIRTTGIVIDDEAYFKGGIEILQKAKTNGSNAA
jgi:cytoskeletal protein CcmA (bactofilin family)